MCRPLEVPPLGSHDDHLHHGQQSISMSRMPRTPSYRDTAKEAQRLAIAQGGMTIKLMTAGLLAVTAAHSYWMWHRQHRQRSLSVRAAQAATHRSGGPRSCAGPLWALDASPRTRARSCLDAGRSCG